MNLLSQFAQYTNYYDYTTLQPTAASAPLTFTVILILIMITLVILAGSYALSAWLLSRIFKKAGVNPGIAWVPVYNVWKMLELGDQQGFWSILLFLPIVSYVAVVFLYIAYYRIGLKFEKSGVFVLWAIFFSPVWLIWIAFDDSKWHPKALAGK